MKNFWYLFAAYSVIWIVIFIYTLILYRRMKGLEAELQAIKNDLQKSGK